MSALVDVKLFRQNVLLSNGSATLPLAVATLFVTLLILGLAFQLRFGRRVRSLSPLRTPSIMIFRPILSPSSVCTSGTSGSHFRGHTCLTHVFFSPRISYLPFFGERIRQTLWGPGFISSSSLSSDAQDSVEWPVPHADHVYHAGPTAKKTAKKSTEQLLLASSTRSPSTC